MKIDLRLLLKGSSRYLFLASIFSALLWVTFLVSNAWLISDLIIRVIDVRAIFPQLSYLIALWVTKAIFISFFEYWTSNKAIAIKYLHRKETSENYSGIRKFSPAVISNLLTKGLNSLDTFYGRFLPQLIFALIVPTILILVVLSKDLLSAIVAALTLPIIPFFGALIGRYTNDAVGKKWRTLGVLSSYFEDSLRGFATLKVFGRSRSQSERIEAMGKRYSEETMKVLRISFLSSLALELAATISVAVIAVEIGLRLVGGHIQFKNALMILILAPEIYFPIRNAASLFHASIDGSEAIAKLKEIPNQLNEKAGGKSYPSGTKFWVGESGSGKTSKAMELINTFDRSGIGWIPQLPRLAQGSIRKQFQLINRDISDKDIEVLLKRVNLNLADLPNGLDSELEAGSELLSIASGGQIRKVAIARALVRIPKLLIADEPTADLDPVSSQIVMETLRSLGCGLIVITHDLSLLKPEDDVVRFER